MQRLALLVLLPLLFMGMANGRSVEQVPPAGKGLLPTEKLDGDGVWVHAKLNNNFNRMVVKVWFDEQFLGDGKAYLRRAKEFGKWKRRDLRRAAIKTLKALSDRSHQAAQKELAALVKEKKISNLDRHWIINGFTCTTTPEGLKALKQVKGVKKIFAVGPARGSAAPKPAAAPAFKPVKREAFDPEQYKHPWYIYHLQADKVWKKFGVAGKGTLNVIHDFNFVFSDNVTCNLYRNTKEIPGNDKDDDGNGLVDDYHGFDFAAGSANLTRANVPLGGVNPRFMHGYMCAAIVCAAGCEGKEYEFGIAPEGAWAGVIAGSHLESAIEWAVSQGADTYSMSFSMPGLGDYRSHWRKVMEHGSYCGVYFVSGAGNFAQQVKVPVQMRTPEDIPEVVFAAAGVQRNFSRTVFSSKGPVRWQTEHYQDGMVQKPEVCAFNHGLPILKRDGTVINTAINGNSFAGPMFCGSIALMLSADPDLLPWDLKKIITSTATDVAAKGVDYETGHGLINCYRAVKEVLRRKAVREGKNAKRYEGREEGDTLNIPVLQKELNKASRVVVGRLQPRGQAARVGIKQGDAIVSYYDMPIRSSQDLQAAKKKAMNDNKKVVALIVNRNGKSMGFEVNLGPLGFFPAMRYDLPTFK